MKCVRGEGSGYAYQCLKTSPLQKILSAGDSWPPAEDALEIVKRNPKVCSGFFLAAGDIRLFFKKFPFVGWSGAFKRWTGMNRAANNWAVGWRLRQHNVNVPQPHALITGTDAAWYVCSALDGVVSFEKAIHDANADDNTVLTLCLRATEQLVRMHEAGIVHGDFKWGNVLVVPDGKVMITDLDSTYCRRYIGRALAARDLARFLVSGLEMGLDQVWAHTVIRRYASERGFSAADMTARLCSRVAGISKAHQRKYGRKGICLDPITGRQQQ